jgi:hypothetical protein
MAKKIKYRAVIDGREFTRSSLRTYTHMWFIRFEGRYHMAGKICEEHGFSGSKALADRQISTVRNQFKVLESHVVPVEVI